MRFRSSGATRRRCAQARSAPHSASHKEGPLSRAFLPNAASLAVAHQTDGFCDSVSQPNRLTRTAHSRCTQAILLFLLLLSAVAALAQTPAVTLSLGNPNAPVSFPETAVGSASASQNVVLAINSPVTIGSISMQASQGGVQEFAVSNIIGWGCAADGVTVNQAGSVCTVPVSFQPGYPGLRLVPLVVVTSAGTFHFGLEGIGLAPQVALLPGIINTVAGNGSCT